MNQKNGELNNILSYLCRWFSVSEVKQIKKKEKTDWFYEEILGSLSDSYEFVLEDGNRFVIDLDEECEFLTLSKLFIMKRSNGLGTLIMELLKEYSCMNCKYFMVVQVINPKFFQKFKWLNSTDTSIFDYDAR